MVMRKHGWIVCAYCLVEVEQCDRDHIIPRRYGGQNAPGNIVWVCEECNRAKADSMPRGVKLRGSGMPGRINWPELRQHVAYLREDMNRRRCAGTES